MSHIKFLLCLLSSLPIYCIAYGLLGRCSLTLKSFIKLRKFQLAFGLALAILGTTQSPPVMAQTPSNDIFEAAGNGDVDALSHYLKDGAAVDAPAQQGRYKGKSALIVALKKNQYGAAAYLLDHGANPNQTYAYFTALAYAFYVALHEQHVSGGSNIDTRWMKLLLDHGADINQRLPFDNAPLLTMAIGYPKRPDPKLISFLLSFRPDVDARFTDEGGGPCSTALILLATHGFANSESVAVAQLLLDAGASPNASSPDGVTAYRTPLSYAVESFAPASATVRAANEAGISLLIARGADIRGSATLTPPQNYPSTCPRMEESKETKELLRYDRSNMGLTSLLSNTLLYPEIFDRIVAAANPIKRGEIGFAPLHRISQISRYPDQLSPQERVVLERGVKHLLALGAAVNPSLLYLDPDAGWNDFWTSTLGRDRVGAEYLPLYMDKLPDPLYEKLLQAGASPAIRRYEGISSGDSVLVHLIKTKAATKLALIRQNPGLLKIIPTWCGRSVEEIALGLSYIRRSTPMEDLLLTPTGQEAKHLILSLLKNPECGTSLDGSASLSQINDSEITAALKKSPPPEKQITKGSA